MSTSRSFALTVIALLSLFTLCGCGGRAGDAASLLSTISNHPASDQPAATASVLKTVVASVTPASGQREVVMFSVASAP